jgi:histidyl-tRNA synthetase
MMKDFGGPDICAIGFAMGVERLLSVAKLEPVHDEFFYLAYLGDEAKKEAILLARFLRSKGVECLLEFKERGLKSQLGRASKLGASWALIIGEEEVRKGRYQVKDMKKGTQTEAPKDSILRMIGRAEK